MAGAGRPLKNPLSQTINSGQSGFDISHALAVFIERPQAENQIGAKS